MSWSKDCVISETTKTLEMRRDSPATVIQPTGAIFQVSSTKLYVPAVTLSIYDNIKFLKNIKQGFKIKFSWNKYRSETTTQTKNNNLHYLIDPTLIDYLHFHLKMVMMILQEILLVNITCH